MIRIVTRGAAMSIGVVGSDPAVESKMLVQVEYRKLHGMRLYIFDQEHIEVLSRHFSSRVTREQ